MFKFYRSVLAAGVVALGLAACGDNVTVQPPPPPSGGGVTSVTVTPANITLGVGQTEQLAVSVIADSGVSTAVNWTPGNAAIATVSSSGLVTAVALGSTSIIATSVANPSRSFAVQVTVTNATTFSITPSAMTLAPGQHQAATATAVLLAGQTAAPIVWSSLSPNIATVANGCGTTAGVSACQITGVAQGTAVITASTTVGGQNLTATLSVTVGQGASVSLASINAGATAGTVPGCSGIAGQPVILTNVNCQINVVVNLQPGVQAVDSLTVTFKQGTAATPVTKTLARQVYNGTVPAAGAVTLLVNTANFNKNIIKGTAAVDLFNGPTTAIVQVWRTGIDTVGSGFNPNGATNCSAGTGLPTGPTCAATSMVMANTDGWAADMQKCDSVIPSGVGPQCNAAQPLVGPGGTNASKGGFAVSTQANAGATYWGGPGETGQIAAELYAVVYDNNPAFPAGSQLNRCKSDIIGATPAPGVTPGTGADCINIVSWTIGSVFANCGPVPQSQIGPPNPVVATPPTPFFRQVFGTGTNATNACSGYENIGIRRDNVIVANGAQDAQNNAYPTGPLIPNAVVFASTPDSNRFDYRAPSSVTKPAVTGSENFNWVNAIWPFNPGGTLVTDNGVGPAPSSWKAFATGNGGLGGFPTAITTGADLAETNQNCAPGCDGYFARAWATDLLGNFNNSGNTASFGDDRTAPMIRISTTAAPSLYTFPGPINPIYTGGGAASVLDSSVYNAIDGAAGLIYGANITTPGDQTLFLSPSAGTGDSLRIEALDNRSGLSRGIENTNAFAQNGGTGGVSSIYSTTAATFGPATIDGWLPALALHVTNGRVPGAPPANPAYYTTTEFVVDKAGNVSGCPITGNILGTVGGSIASICTAAAPSTTAGTNSASGVAGGNEFARRTLALDPGQPAVTGVSPNNSYKGNQQAVFTLGSQNDLEVIDARLRLVYPSLYIGDGTTTASAGLVWSYALSNSFMPAGAGFSAGPASGSGVNFGFFAPIGIRFDGAVNALPGNGLGIVNPQLTPLTIDMFTLNVQETCTGAGAPTASCAINGDPVPAADVPFTKPAMTPTNVAVQVRDVFGSWIFNTTAGAATGVSPEVVVPILPATVDAPGGYAVGYIFALLGPTSSCPQGGTPQAAGTQSCVGAGINFRAEPSLSSGSTKVFRATESLSTTLPVFTRVDLFGLNAANEWVFIQRCTVPSPITPNGSAQPCGLGTVTGTDNGNERYWLYAFTSVPGAGFTQFRAIGTNSSGFGLASTRQP